MELKKKEEKMKIRMTLGEKTVEEGFTECEDREEYKFENGDVYKRMRRNKGQKGHSFINL